MAEKEVETPDNPEDGAMLDDTELTKQREAAFAEGAEDDEDGKKPAAQAEEAKGEGTDNGEKEGDKPKPEETGDEPAVQPADDEDAPVTLSKRELAHLRATADLVPRLQTQLESVNGRIGSMKQAVDGFRTGSQVEITDEDFKEMQEQFGSELVGANKAMLERVLKRVRGTAASVSTEDVVKQVKFETRMEDLTEAYPDWQVQLGNNPNGQPNLEAPLRKWLTAHPDKAYAENVSKTGDPAVVKRALDKMHADVRAAEAKAKAAQEQPKPKPKPQSQTPDIRRQRMAAAATPRTDGGQPTVKQKTPQDYFNEGWEQGV